MRRGAVRARPIALAARVAPDALLVVLALLAPALPIGASIARAQDPIAVPPEAPLLDPTIAEARALFDAGRALASERRWGEALDRFRRSLELVDHGSTRYNVGACLYALDRYAEAIPVLERYLAAADPAIEGDSVSEARAMLEHARRTVASIVLHVEPRGARVRIDGLPLEGGPERTLVVDPGMHVLRADAGGHVPVLDELHVAPGERVVRVVELVRESATLEVATGSPGARILVDGREIGVSEASTELAPGEHEIEIVDAGRRVLRRVTLAPGERVRQSIELGSGSGGIDPVLAATIGALAMAAAGAAVAIGYEASQAGAAAPTGGSTGVVLAFVVAM